MSKKTVGTGALILVFLMAALTATGCQGKSSGNGSASGAAPQRVTTCSVCHGDGVCWHCDGDQYRNGRRCSSCDGTGKCDYCQGAGSFSVYVINGQDYTRCGSCQGNGQCSVCNGSGDVQGWHSDTFGSISGNCLMCHGKGTCTSCKGSGYLRLSAF